MRYGPAIGIDIPAEAVKWRYFAGRPHHLGLARGVDDVVFAIHHHRQVARHVAGTCDDAAHRRGHAMRRGLFHRALHAKPWRVTDRDRVMAFAVRDEQQACDRNHDGDGTGQGVHFRLPGVGVERGSAGFAASARSFAFFESRFDGLSP